MGRESKGRRKKEESRRQRVATKSFSLMVFGGLASRKARGGLGLDLVDGARVENGKDERENELDGGKQRGEIQVGSCRARM
jgi:hypothetical protein